MDFINYIVVTLAVVNIPALIYAIIRAEKSGLGHSGNTCAEVTTSQYADLSLISTINVILLLLSTIVGNQEIAVAMLGNVVVWKTIYYFVPLNYRHYNLLIYSVCGVFIALNIVIIQKFLLF